MSAPPAPGGFTPDDRRQLLGLARESIRCQLEAARGPDPGSLPEALQVPRCAFVTLHVDGVLRGCVGVLSPTGPLASVVAEMALAAAGRDDRFLPIQAGELDQLAVEVSVLTPARPIGGPEEVEIGRHGLIISHGPQRGVLLPHVATEQGWDAERFLSHTCLKAGLPEDAWREWAAGHDDELRIEVFESERFSE